MVDMQRQLLKIKNKFRVRTVVDMQHLNFINDARASIKHPSKRMPKVYLQCKEEGLHYHLFSIKRTKITNDPFCLLKY